jgi:hypothetical protein
MTKEAFIKGVANWDNHRRLLYPALQATTGEVVEMGCGDGSTAFLREYCRDAGRMLYSYENNYDWWRRMSDYNSPEHKVIHVTDWDVVALNHVHPSVVLLDHAPGERRKFDVEKFANKASVLVLHDSEPAADHGYQMRQHIKLFKYWIDLKTEGAWASAASNFVDVTQFEF